MSSDGSMIAASNAITTASDDIATGFVWEALTGRILSHFHGNVASARFSADGMTFTHVAEGHVVLRDPRNGKIVRTLTIPGPDTQANAIGISADGTLIAIRWGYKDITITNLDTGEHVRTIETNEPVDNLQFSTDNHWLGFLKPPDTLRFADLRTGAVHAIPADIGGSYYAFLPDAEHVLINPMWGSPAIYNIEMRKVLRRLSSEGGQFCLSPNGTQVIQIGHESTFHIEDLSTGAVLYRSLSHLMPLTNASASSDGAFITLLGDSLLTWDPVAEYAPIQRKIDTGANHGWLCISADGSRLTFAPSHESEGKVFLMDTSGGLPRQVFDSPHQLRALAISSDGEWIASVHADRRLRVMPFEQPTGALEMDLSFDVLVELHDDPKDALSISESGRYVSVCGQGDQATVVVIDREKAAVIQEYQLDTPTRAVAISHDGSRVAWVDTQGMVFIKEVVSSENVATYFHPKVDYDPWEGERWRVAITWSKDGRYLITARHNTTMIWDSRSKTPEKTDGKYIRGINGPIWPPSLARGGRIAVDNSAEKFVFWDTRSGRPLLTFYWSDPIHWLAVSPEGHYRCSEQMKELLVWVVRKDDGTCELLSEKQFFQKHNWVNDPSRVVVRLN